MGNISLLGWVLITFLAVVVISLNLGLLLSLRQRKIQRPDNVNMFARMGHSIRHPWEKEDKQLEDLAQRINKLRGDASNTDADKKLMIK